LRRWTSNFLRSPAFLFAVGVVVTIILAVGVVIALLRTGDARAVSDNAPLIAAVIALGGIGTAQMVSIALEDQRTQEARALEDERTREARNLEALRTHEARDLEAQRAGEAALQNYFEAVGELLIEKPLHRASPADNLSTLVRAQTLSVLEGLDPDRKRILLLFLYESGLIYERKLVVRLAAAKLNEANLGEADLSGADLSGTNLGEADLSGADLSGARLIEANLSEADLSGARLSDTYLSGADLSGARLIEADLIGAKLIEADLSDTYLNLANLSRADLRGADLRGAHLSKAVGLTDEQIAAAEYLDDATMPNGQKHEDWLKSRGRGTDGENSGPS
jgi:hypothetical protein